MFGGLESDMNMHRTVDLGHTSKSDKINVAVSRLTTFKKASTFIHNKKSTMAFHIGLKCEQKYI